MDALEFQQYNTKLGGSSPISMEELEVAASKEATMVAVQATTPPPEPVPVVPNAPRRDRANRPRMVPNAPRKNNKRKKDTAYEVYDTGRENLLQVFDTVRDAWKYADNKEVVVVKREETTLHRPKRKKVEVSLEETGHTDFGHYQCLHLSMQAKGKQQTWWIDSALSMDGSATDEMIRNSAVMLRQVPAATVVEWVLQKFTVCNELDCWPIHCQDDTDRGKLRQMTHRIRKAIARSQV